MKIKSDIEVWDHFETTLLKEGNNESFYYGRFPLDKVVELEETDFIKCINICKQFKKDILKEEVELDLENFNKGQQPRNNSIYLETFRENVADHRNYTITDLKIRKVVNETFAREFKLLENLTKLAELHSRFNRVTGEYLKSKLRYETMANQLESFRTLKNSGLSPEEFSWDVLEPVKQPEE